jgi:ribosomal protein S12 methylthiotransferase
VDGSTSLVGSLPVGPGDLVRAKVVASDGVDLVAEPVEMLSPAGTR